MFAERFFLPPFPSTRSRARLLRIQAQWNEFPWSIKLFLLHLYFYVSVYITDPVVVVRRADMRVHSICKGIDETEALLAISIISMLWLRIISVLCCRLRMAMRSQRRERSNRYLGRSGIDCTLWGGDYSLAVLLAQAVWILFP